MMVEKGTKFTFNGKQAKALEYMPFVGLWFFAYMKKMKGIFIYSQKKLRSQERKLIKI